MQNKPTSFFHSFKRTLKSRIISGVLVLVPLGITIWIMKLLYAWTVGAIEPGISAIFHETLPPIYISLICVGLIIILTYVMGVLATAVIGKKLLALGEAMLMKIPIVKTIYSATKQVIDAISMPSSAAFKAVVIVEFPHPGMRAFAFLTGTILDADNKPNYKLFIPTTPNPTSGFFIMVPPEKAIMTTLSVEETFKMFVSGGIISPERFGVQQQVEEAVVAKELQA